jgi:hypothetical protein
MLRAKTFLSLVYDNSTISPTDARRRCDTLNVFGCGCFTVRVFGTFDQLSLRVRVSMLIRSVSTYVEKVTYTRYNKSATCSDSDFPAFCGLNRTHLRHASIRLQMPAKFRITNDFPSRKRSKYRRIAIANWRQIISRRMSTSLVIPIHCSSKN